jgi:hypothetical protein
LTAFAVTVVAFSTLVTIAAPAEATVITTGGGTALPIGGFSHVVVDDARGRALISSGAGRSKIGVVDFAGTTTATIDLVPGPTGMAIVGNILFVAMRDGGAIQKFDAGTLGSLGTLATGLPSMQDLVYANGYLWTYSTAGASGDPDLVRVDLSGNKVSYAVGFDYAPGLVASPTGMALATWERGLSPASINSIDVSTGRPAAPTSRT